ncbi:ABC transporter substrate-binding protein [Microbacterium elymi]|uniref:Sugar ABC transporter substrate-binding protein n=1 Tax=Microbacterium elymi TaxID=2909587 RepID=A0ABY5NMK1_9MICO|nr:sugar ABC transporter substrate-binding protein [Microbacterium elymi]UUT36426.1 sugar ABC transporter substrate-binding protein [Microbacterium elymi]
MLAATATTSAVALALTGCSGGSGSNDGGNVTLTFSQWWAPEMPSGALQKIVDDFHKANPKITIKLISAPFASLQTQTISQAASGTLPDIVGLDGSWVNPLYKQGALYNLTDAMKKANYDDSELASQVAFKGSTYMIPVVNFVYPLFTNDAILSKAGITTPPTTWSEFSADAKKISKTESGVKGWVVPLGTTNPNGAQNDILSWAWASGGSMLKDGEPNLTDNPDVSGAVDMVKDLITSDAVLPGANSLQETDKVTNFINGRVGMMVDSLAHVTTITQGAADLKFSVSAQAGEGRLHRHEGHAHRIMGHRDVGEDPARGAGVEVHPVPDEQGHQLDALDPGQRVPRQQDLDARLLRCRPALQGGVRHLPEEQAGQRVHRPAGSRPADDLVPHRVPEGGGRSGAHHHDAAERPRPVEEAILIRVGSR